ncbi:hypothetical protein AB0I72_01660 [Nocardiopsis sp. NPDC049922]|uniref:hypothetical protein n=1 Tax=Nocardiopsis sp. NPDC049922 TaxID=3155157 RepID=UPI0033E0BDC7
MSNTVDETTELDLDVQDASNGDWDALVSDILRNAGDLTPADPETTIMAGCSGCGLNTSCHCGAGCCAATGGGCCMC